MTLDRKTANRLLYTWPGSISLRATPRCVFKERSSCCCDRSYEICQINRGGCTLMILAAGGKNQSIDGRL